MITQEISPSPSTCTNLIVWALLWKNTRTLPVLCCRFSPHGCWHTHAKVVLRGESFMQKKFGPHPQLAFRFSSHSISCLCICICICICISRSICINLLSWASSISGFLFPSHSISDRSEKQALVVPPLQPPQMSDILLKKDLGFFLALQPTQVKLAMTMTQANSWPGSVFYFVGPCQEAHSS